jgi:hypothetical protein
MSLTLQVIGRISYPDIKRRIVAGGRLEKVGGLFRSLTVTLNVYVKVYEEAVSMTETV